MDIPPTIFPREIEYEWSRDLSRRAARRYFSRRFSGTLIILSILIAVCIFGIIFDPTKGIFGFYRTVLIISFVLILLFIRVYLKMTRTFEEVQNNRIKVRIELDSITWETSESVSTMKWSAIKRIWRFPDVLLLFRYKTTEIYFVLPVARLGVTIGRAIEDKVKQHGGQVA